MKKNILFVIFIFVANTILHSQQTTNNDSYGNKIVPDSIPLLFGKDIVSTQYFEHSSPEFSKNGKEMYWTVVPGAPGSEAFVYFSKIENSTWTIPKKVTFLGGSDDMYPIFSFDFNQIYFSSSKPTPYESEASKRSIWYVEKMKDGYTEPVYVGFDSLDIYGLDVAKSGNLYFMAQNVNKPQKYDLYSAQFKDGRYSKPEILPEPINSQYYEDNPFLSDDENYMIFESNRPGGFGGIDLYISIKKVDGTWNEPQNIGPPINSKSSERFPKISNDGKYFFWGSDKNAVVNSYDFDIYWIRTSGIYNLVKKNE